MKGNLMLEIYAAKKEIQPIEFFRYRLTANSVFENKYEFIRGLCWKVSKCNGYIPVFEDGVFIYSLKSLNVLAVQDGIIIEPDNKIKLNIIENKRIYEKVVEHFIHKKLDTVRTRTFEKKYTCRRGTITCDYIKRRQGSEGEIVESEDRSIRLKRKHNISANINEEGKLFIEFTNSSEFASKLTIADFISRRKHFEGLPVKNEWTNDKQSGIVVGIEGHTVAEKLTWGRSLKDYYMDDNSKAYLIKGIPDNTPAVNVKLRNGSILAYYPQALIPIISYDQIKTYDSKFSQRIESLVKLNIKQRTELDRELIREIGSIEELEGLAFYEEPCSVDELKYSQWEVKMPTLLCADGKAISSSNKLKVFENGFFSVPNRKLKIGYLYPKGYEKYLIGICNEIYSFCKLGKHQGKDCRYIKKGILDVEMKKEKTAYECYEPGDITDYKRAAYKFRDKTDIDLVLTIVPNETGEDNPYDPFKRVWAEMNLPSQMISMDTARLFEKNEIPDSKKIYYLQNIVLGILGKTGGAPWIIKDMPGEIDCFVGLDVATIEKGIHYPACAVVFDKAGQVINFYRPQMAQRGEKITTNILQEIFDDVIIGYEEKYGTKPKNIVIHRDGFSNEDLDWYIGYFGKKNIEFSIIEVRKNTSSRIIFKDEEVYKNPACGHCISNQDKAYLVTTDIKENLGAPNPILIERTYGKIDMEEAVTQVLYLSQIHSGSTKKLRLPVTTGYADKICKNIDYVPKGRLEGKLFFL